MNRKIISLIIISLTAIAGIYASTDSNLTEKELQDATKNTALEINEYANVDEMQATNCTTVEFSNQTVGYSKIVAGCRINSQSVIVNSNAVLTLDATEYVAINSPFTVNAGCVLILKSK